MRGAEAESAVEPFWREHLGLVISAALTVFIVLKITAVARWNPTTARGILAANGTTNVLVGSVLTSLPTFYILLFVGVRPHIEERLELRRRTTVERSAARMTTGTLTVLLLLLVPVGLLLVLLAIGIAHRTVLRFVMPRRRIESKAEDRVTRFELVAVQISTVLSIFLVLLPVPWLPSESIDVAGRGPELGYVLSRGEQDVVVLMDSPRRLERLDASKVETALCDGDASWYLKSLPQLALGRHADYPSCPRSVP